jgi:hypothetical protein
MGFLLFFVGCSFIWSVFISFSWGFPFVPHVAPDDPTMHKTVIYFMLRGEDFYSAWRHATAVCGDLSDFRIYRTPLIFYAVLFLTGWAGDFFIFPLAILCVTVAACNLILSFWTTQRMLGSGWAGLAAAITQYAYFWNVIPRFQIDLFAMPFLILAVYFAWAEQPWLSSGNLCLAFLIKEVFAFALPAFLAMSLLRRQWRHTIIYLGTFTIATALYILHTVIAQPIADPTLIFAAPLPTIFINLAGFLWFGFGVLYYNVLLPITIGGFYPFSPIPPFLPYPFFLLILAIQSSAIWGVIFLWGIKLIQDRRFPQLNLGVLGIVLWLIPLLISATAPVDIFALWWVDFGIWHWFPVSYVGFQLLVALSWQNLKHHTKEKKITNGEITR